MRVLILGGDGYLGWPTAMYLSQRGHDVLVVDNYFRRRACLLDLVQRVREYGTLGLSQLWKDLANFKQDLRIYRQGIRKGEIFKPLGPLGLHRKIQPSRGGKKK